MKKHVVAWAVAAATLFPLSTAGAAEVDFSCMSMQVLGKRPLTDRHKEYDIVLQNRCPGPVYWNMCIERINPLSHAIVEAHNPSGVVETESKSRVNLQMKTGPSAMVFRKRYQEFYVSVDYAVKPPASAACVAVECESAKRDIRARIDANWRAWGEAELALEKDIAAECPESGWGKTDEVEICETGLREAAQPELERLAQTDAGLREQLQQLGGENCRIHAGDLIGTP